MDETDSTRWIERLKAGDAQAAEALWERYFTRLVGLARRKLRSTPCGVKDEEDAVIDAFDSFYRGVQQGRFPRLSTDQDLWQVLLMLTARKSVNQAKHIRRAKRGGGLVQGEAAIDAGSNVEKGARGLDYLIGDEPSPEFAATMTEEFRRLLHGIEDDHTRLIAFWKFEGRSNSEIAAALDCSLTSVERKLRMLRRQITEQLAGREQ